MPHDMAQGCDVLVINGCAEGAAHMASAPTLARRRALWLAAALCAVPPAAEHPGLWLLLLLVPAQWCPPAVGLPLGLLRGLWRMPSRSRTNRILAGKSSTPHSTRMRHSGQRSSFLELTMLCRQRRQKVCWHGSTRALVSSRSRHTEHSSRSSSDDSSMSAAPSLLPPLSSSSPFDGFCGPLEVHSHDAPRSMENGRRGQAPSRGIHK
ncbi:hypothetical protein GDO81_005515 [Engystomops pustulosus]|uniref:Uncharacterized protein n=1 Tax=Engystomops pustulosus TaxID=76066 RepID=A0AAV7CRZ6_ENGPU|nr:hypothetical protein GDO81_005515 [Engystomops pustulosus]